MAKTLKDVMPPEFLNVEFEKTRSRKHVDVEVVEEHGATTGSDKPWPGGHKHVHFWVLLKNGRAVGWNESQSHGWSFPIVTHKAD